MKEGPSKRWLRLTLAVLLIVGAAAPALANQEMHPGARAFFPLWDVRTSASNPEGRLTFIILTRLAYINQGAGATTIDPRSNCTTRYNAPNGLTPVNLEYYGKSCESRSEIIYMSCADIDVVLLTHPDNPNLPSRPAFASLAAEGIGAVDVHLLDGNLGLSVGDRANENSLMANAIISDTSEGWAAVYPAAMAKSTTCPNCAAIGQGAGVGYEPYPMELFLPFALADDSRAGGGPLSNLLSLWAPGLFPGDILASTAFRVEGHWYDGRERPTLFDASGHSIIECLGCTGGIDNKFNVARFTCGHALNVSTAENDGGPRNALAAAPPGQGSLNCDPLRNDLPGNPPANIVGTDAAHPSDDFDNGGTTSRPIGWWNMVMTSDTAPKPVLGNIVPGFRSGRGLAGVVLSSGSGGVPGKGVGDAIRLWHKDPCEIGPEGLGIAYGPPHLRDNGVLFNFNPIGPPQEFIVFFNVFDFDSQGDLCEGAAILDQ